MLTFQDKGSRSDVTLVTAIHCRFKQAINDLASCRSLSVSILALLAFAGSASIGLIRGIPEPRVHDEFSYLLAADTFAQGRLTNPTHPMWVHFESFHIIHQPTYMSKYPPGQGAILALGQVLTGYPIVGVWLSMGLMCAAICWMLQAWVPPRWAVIGGLFSVLHPILGIGGSWAQSYWKGALAATGGALVLGGIRYIIKNPRFDRSLLIGAGLAILANTRPYEGLLLSLGAASILLIKIMSKPDLKLNLIVLQVVLPLVLMGIATVGSMGYYNYRVTGNIFRFPYHVHQTTYGVAPLFVWQQPSSMPAYRHVRLSEFHAITEFSFYTEKLSLAGFAQVNIRESLVYFALAVNILAIPLIVVIHRLRHWISRNWWARAAFLTYLVFTIGVTLETHSSIHYWAPVLAFNYYFTVQALRLCGSATSCLRTFIVSLMFGIMVLQLFLSVKQKTINGKDALSAHVQRANLLARLERLPGYHAVLVGYGPEQSIHREWVYNGADIDRAKVIWARDMDPSANCDFVNYFKDRNIWLLDVERDGVPVKLSPFPRQSCP